MPSFALPMTTLFEGIFLFITEESAAIQTLLPIVQSPKTLELAYIIVFPLKVGNIPSFKHPTVQP